MRKLAMTAGSFSAAIFLAQYLLPAAVQLWAGAALLFAFAASIFIKRPRALRFAALGLAAGLIWNYAYGLFGLRAARALDGTTQTVTAKVLSYPEDTDYGKSVLIRAGKAKCRLYIYNDDYAELEAGDEISIKASFTLTGEKTGGDYYYSLGIPLFGYAREKPSVLGKAPFSVLYIPAKAGKLLGDSIDASFGSAAPFIKALVTGDRSDLKKDGYAYSLMSVTGIAHCVAVSGMHVSFLAGLVYFLLGKKRPAAVVCIPAVLFFMAMTGFSASVTRAGVMQLAVCAASLTRREYDAKTALFLSLLLLLALNPYSAQNAGLQLSFGATLGILLFGERLRAAMSERLAGMLSLKPAGRLARGLVSTLSVSLGALVFTLPLTALIFGRVSVIAPLTNLLALWAVSICFVLGLIAALAGLIWLPLASALALPAILLVKYIYFIIGLLGRIPFASVYTESVYISFWLALVYVLLAAAVLLPGRGKGSAFAAAAAASFAVVLAFELHEANSADLRVTALDVGQGQCVVITAKGYTAVVDCGGSASRSAGDIAAEYLSSLGRTRVDSLILTHYHRDHAGGAAELMRRVKVARLIAPDTGLNPDIAWELEPEIESQAARSGVKLLSLGGDICSFEEGGVKFTLVPPLDYADENEIGVCVLFSCGSFDGLITGDVGSETELRLMERISMPDVELLVAGHHGSAESTSAALLEALRPECVLISVGRNSYGQPSEKVLARLAACSPVPRVCRTDEMGDITVTYDMDGEKR